MAQKGRRPTARAGGVPLAAAKYERSIGRSGIIVPMRKITLLITLLFCLTLTGSTALSQTNIQVYLPLIANLDTSAWLGPDGGSVVAVALDPQNPETVYAGTWGRGVFKSVDGGASWLPATNGLDNLYIQSLAVDPLVPSVLYAGTYKDGMYKSLDGGQSWFAINTNIQAEAIVYTIAIDRSDSNYIYTVSYTHLPAHETP